MITIILDGKTYSPNGENCEESYRVQFTSEITKGFLEEVKENKEMPDIVQRWEEGKEGMKQVWDSIKRARYPSILEKLKKKLEELQIEGENDGCEGYAQGVMDTCETLRDFLTSLETSPQFTPGQEEPKETGWKEWEKHTFKPGDMIEVSNDKKKWYEGAIFSKYDENDEYPYIVDGEVPFVHWKFARPLKEESPEIVVSDFQWDRIEENGGMMEWVHDIGVQVELLTRAYQQLSKANKK